LTEAARSDTRIHPAKADRFSTPELAADGRKDTAGRPKAANVEV